MKSVRLPWPCIVLLACLGGLVASYVPLLQLGKLSGVHLDVSLLYIVVVIVVVVSGKQLWLHRPSLMTSLPWLCLVGLATYTSLSVLWSGNVTRAILTSGFLWLMVLLASVIVVWLPVLRTHFLLVRYVMATAFAMAGLFALWQIAGDALGVDSSLTLLPTSYQSGQFGVARPIGFALEPQFFASLLLVPFAWLSYNFLKGNHQWKLIACLVATSTLLLLTLSRGGLVAALVILTVLVIAQKNWRASGLLFGVGAASLLCSGIAIATAATVNTRDAITAPVALNRSVNQLSLGLVKLPTPSPPPRHTPTTSDGYVKSSTTSRLSMSARSIDLWQTNWQTMLFGTGIGDFGSLAHQKDPSLPLGSVVNNYYLEMLVELGLVGVMIFAGFVVWLLIEVIQKRDWLLLALLLGFFTQWCFFSGNANVVHVWVIIGLGLSISTRRRLLQ